ncbi:MAG: heparan-alpha-glucosaminide N-acetyltransferase domain-containing protein [Acidobacteriaceae bacterium]
MPSLDALPIPTQTSAVGQSHRWLSLDVLRGLTIAFMIMVNNNGDSSRAYWALQHADWNGCTPTDIVFPTFLFLVGISTVLSVNARLAKGATKKSILLHTIRRAVILFLLGLLVNNFPLFDLHTLRVYGVLQRIAICYFIVSLLYLANPSWKNKAVIAFAALVSYWVLMRFVPVPGYGVPTHQAPMLDRNGNLASWLDRQIFSASHLYEETSDPEGLLSTLPAVATTLFGTLAGIWICTNKSIAQKAKAIAWAGLSGLVLGGIWNFEFPINKNLWTSSYVLYASGWSLLLLALSIWIVDMRGAHKPDPARRRLYTPFLVLGTNAIAAYLFSELLPGVLSPIHPQPTVNLLWWFYFKLLGVIGYPPVASLLFSICFLAVCWLPMYLLYRRRIFLKI